MKGGSSGDQNLLLGNLIMSNIIEELYDQNCKSVENGVEVTCCLLAYFGTEVKFTLLLVLF